MPTFPAFESEKMLKALLRGVAHSFGRLADWDRSALLRISNVGVRPSFGFRISPFGLLLPHLVALFVLPLSLLAQQDLNPHVGYVFPAGGRQGTTFQVKVGGQLLNGVTNVFVSGQGVTAKVLEHTKPLTQQQFNDLREKLTALRDKRQAANRNRFRRRPAGGAAQSSTNAVWTVADEKQFEEIMKKLSTFQRRPPNPAIAETVTLQVTTAADADPGDRELRLGTQLGLSNPLVFRVGQLPEFRKKEPTSDEQPLGRKLFRNNNEQKAVPATETTITLPAVVNGQVLAGGVDRYHFFARKGQQLVVSVSARDLIPYLADAVPGWFQATLTLFNAQGKELAYDDDFRFHPDPVLHYVIPSDGQYYVEIKDAIYRGREDFVYRIALGELPFVTSIFPLGGPAGSRTTVELKGWNLPVTQITLDNTTNLPGLYPFRVANGKTNSNLVPFAVDGLPECLEQEPNNSASDAQPVTLPLIVNGRIQKPGDWDVFRFEGHAGEPIVAEVYARRLDSPLDSVLKLTDASGRQLAFNDDHEDKGSGLNTHHADSYLAATLPANGTYYLHLGDVQGQGGPDYAYRLRLSAPQPDFALRLVPSSINARAGVSTPITVYALRKDGFTNEIKLALHDAPAGFQLSGASIPAGQDQVRLTLSAPAFAPKTPVKLSLEGRGECPGRELVRQAVPAEDMMQAFAYHHLVPAQELDVAVLGRFGARNGVRILGSTPVNIPVGGTARIRLGAPTSAFTERFELELSNPPEGLVLKKVSPSDEGAELVLQSDASKCKAGLKGNLIVSVFAGKNFGAAPKAKKQLNQRRPAVGALPAIPFEIVDR